MRWLDAVSDSVDTSLNSRRQSEGQGILVCCSPWALKESNMTQSLNNNSNLYNFPFGAAVAASHSFCILCSISISFKIIFISFQVHREFSRTDHMLSHKTHLDTFKKFEIVSEVFSNHNVEINRRVEIQNRTLENSQIWKADSMLLNKEVKKK